MSVARPSVYFHLEGTRDLGSSRIRGFDLAERLAGEAEVHVKGGRDRMRPDRPFWSATNLYFQKTTQVTDYALARAALLGRARRLAFDIDDVKHVTNRDARVLRKAKFMQDRMLRLADVVTVASHEMLAYARRHSTDVRLARTPVDLAKYRPREHDGTPSERFTVGWLGNGNAYAEDLKMVVAPLRALAANYPLRVRIVGALGNRAVHETFGALRADGVVVEITDAIDWKRPGATGDEIRAFDVGMYPLRDLEFNRAKGGFKLLEYMASAVPAVASPVSETKFILDEGAPAIAATTEDDWTRGLDRLLSSAAERKRLGEAGRAYAARHHSFDAFVDVMRAAISR